MRAEACILAMDRVISWRRTAETLGAAAGEVLDLLCPPRCNACDARVSRATDVLCADCWERVREHLAANHYCQVCGKTVGLFALRDGRCHRCLDRRPKVTRLVRVGTYGGVWRDLILSFKFRRCCHLDAFLGDLLAAAVLGAPAVEDVDFFVPVPLHWRRRWQRGYNQAELLARRLGAALRGQGRRARLSRDLVRIRDTPPQTTLPVSQRLVNMRRAFAVRPDAGFEDRHICLVDDVTTTGATLLSAAGAVRRAGAARISAAVLAVAQDN